MVGGALLVIFKIMVDGLWKSKTKRKQEVPVIDRQFALPETAAAMRYQGAGYVSRSRRPVRRSKH